MTQVQRDLPLRSVVVRSDAPMLWGICLSYGPGRDVRAFLFHLLDQDAPAQVGKDREIKVLKEMNELLQFEDDNWSRGSV